MGVARETKIYVCCGQNRYAIYTTFMYTQEPSFATHELSDMCHIILKIVVSFVRKCRKPFLQVKAKGVFSKIPQRRGTKVIRYGVNDALPVWRKRGTMASYGGKITRTPLELYNNLFKWKASQDKTHDVVTNPFTGSEVSGHQGFSENRTDSEGKQR